MNKITKIPKLALGLCTITALLLATAVQAAVPSLISYQGKLTDSGGKTVEDGSYTFIVKLGTEDGSTIIFDSAELDVAVTGGLYSLDIGPVTDLSGLAENEIFIHLQIGEEVFAPVALKSVPYALLSGWSASIADGAVTESSLSEGLATTIAAVPELAMGLDDISGQIAVSGDLTIGELVNALRETTEPVWTSKTNYIIDKGTSFSKVNAFAFGGPSLMNPQTNGPANRPVISIVGALPDGLTYVANTDTLSGNPTTVGVYPLTLVATDFLGQTVSQDVTIEVIDITMGIITGEIVNDTALNKGPLPDDSDGIILAGDTIQLTQNISGDFEKVTGYPFTWSVPSKVSSSPVVTGQVLEDVAKRFTTGLPGLPTTNHVGEYTTVLTLDFSQKLYGPNEPGSQDDNFEIIDIAPGFSLDPMTYDGDPVGGFELLTAGNDSDELEITANLFPGFNGVSVFQWYVARNDDDVGNTVTPIPGENQATYVLEDAIQMFDEDGYAYQNGVPSPLVNFAEDNSYYFPAVHNGFADLSTAMAPFWTEQGSDNQEYRVNDNINVADSPDDILERDGYPGKQGVVAGTTNGIGTLSYVWMAQNDDGDVIDGIPTPSGNGFTIPGGNLDLRDEPYTVSVTITSNKSGTDLSRERVSSTLSLESAIVLVENDLDYNVDVTNDILGDPVIADDGEDAFFGIYSPNEDGFADSETVEPDTDVVFQVTVWIRPALLSNEDDGEFVDFTTPPGRVLNCEWWFDPANGGEDIPIPETNITGPTYMQVDPAGLNRVGVRWHMTLVNVQLDENNDANGDYYAKISSPTGELWTPDLELTVEED